MVETELLRDNIEGQEKNQANMVAMTSNIFKRKAAGEDLNVGRPKKRPRRKAYITMMCVDNIIRQATGKGLEQYRMKGDDGVPTAPDTWKCVSLAPDCGPDIVAMVSYLQYGPDPLVVDVTWDLSHANWNDVKFMYTDCMLWPHMLLMVSAMNMAFGSELSPHRLKQVREAFRDYQATASAASCPLFHYYLPGILAQAGTPERISEDGIEQEVWDNMSNDPILNSMGQKNNLARFMGIVKQAEKDQRIWSKKAWVYLAASMQLGYESTAKVRRILQEMKATAVGGKRLPKENEVKPSVRSGAREGQLRSVAENQLHIAAMMYSDFENRIVQQICLVAATEVSQWHSAQNHILRDLDSVQAFEQEQIQNGIREVLTKTMSKLSSPVALASCEIKARWSLQQVKELQGGSGCGTIMEQQDRCELLQK